ncbi:MAG: carboxy terminal-processing peptidase, partial [Chitinophagales bacterium]|nr:carboxy terminal-processing peptidase [Chitinophagales bacterium]
KMGGLFIKTGPLVQVKPRGTKSNVLNDYDPAVVYDGPLAVMVNENSASASEIIAAALQDYHRAVIVGSNTTYGKGTVQNFYNLDDFVQPEQVKEESLGSIKITIQKYYRINGGTTQLKGVTPDIILPDPYSLIADREQDDPNALGWDEIPAAQYETVKAAYSIATLKSKSEKRVSASSSFQLIKQESQDLKVRTDFSLYPLNFNKFSALQKEWDINEKKYEAISADSNLVNIINLAVDLPKINSDSTAIARNNQFIKNLKKDIYLNEVSQMVVEMK